MNVVVSLKGGLGNQLFQYAAGRALAQARNARLLIDVAGYANESRGREYRLDCFNIQAQLINVHFGLLKRRIKRRLPQRWQRFVYQEQDPMRYDSDLLEINRSVELRGFWQSERYFQAIAPLLRQELTFRQRPTGRNAALTEEIAGFESVSIHVRRGDYVGSNLHLVLPLSYYEAAIARVARVAREARYYIFSDDIPWCREHLVFPGPVTFLDHNGPDGDYEDLRLMSLCKHHIIANSSFSWWGAWLAEHEDQIVIAPRQWLEDSTRTAEDRIPERWEQL